MGDTKFRQTGRRAAQGPYRSDERVRKHQEGLERNAEWAKLSSEAKVQSLLKRRGESKRQLNALHSTLKA